MPLIVSEKSKTMAKTHLIILLTLSLMYYGSEASQSSGVLRPCQTNVTSDQCPPNTSCKQKEKSVDGLCTCLSGYEFNKDFTSNDTYCVVTVTVAPTTVSTSTTTVPTTTTTKSVVTSTVSTTPKATPPKTSAKPTTTTTTKAPDQKSNSSSVTTSTTTTTPNSPFPVPSKPDDGVQKEKVIEPEHMIGGVLLPLLVVATFIGGVFLIRKHNLLERAHSYLTERNWHLPGTARPNYTNDFDEFDDPLLI